VKVIIKVTLTVNALVALLFFGAALATEPLGYALYIALMLFGSYFFPVLIYVTIYHLLWAKRNIHFNVTLSLLIKSFLLALTSLLALFIWAILEAVLFEGLSSSEFWQLVWADYKSEYLAYFLGALVLSVVIPTNYLVFTPKRKIGVYDKGASPMA
jgi:hypothetical protein